MCTIIHTYIFKYVQLVYSFFTQKKIKKLRYYSISLVNVSKSTRESHSHLNT